MIGRASIRCELCDRIATLHRWRLTLCLGCAERLACELLGPARCGYSHRVTLGDVNDADLAMRGKR